MKKTNEEIDEYQKQYLLHRHKLYPDTYTTPINPKEYIDECSRYDIIP